MAVAATAEAEAEATAVTETAEAETATETVEVGIARQATTATAAEAAAAEAATVAEQTETEMGAETAAEAEQAAATETAEEGTAGWRARGGSAAVTGVRQRREDYGRRSSRRWPNRPLPLDSHIVNHIKALTPAMAIAARRFWPPNGWTPRAGEAVQTTYVLLPLLLLPSHMRS